MSEDGLRMVDGVIVHGDGGWGWGFAVEACSESYFRKWGGTCVEPGCLVLATS